jgi:hypothetical protein
MEHGQIALIGWSCVVGGVRRALQDGQGRLWLLFGFIPLTQAHSHLDWYLMKDLHPPID